MAVKIPLVPGPYAFTFNFDWTENYLAIGGSVYKYPEMYKLNISSSMYFHFISEEPSTVPYNHNWSDWRIRNSDTDGYYLYHKIPGKKRSFYLNLENRFGLVILRGDYIYTDLLAGIFDGYNFIPKYSEAISRDYVINDVREYDDRILFVLTDNGRDELYLKTLLFDKNTFTPIFNSTTVWLQDDWSLFYPSTIEYIDEDDEYWYYVVVAGGISIWRESICRVGLIKISKINGSVSTIGYYTKGTTQQYFASPYFILDVGNYKVIAINNCFNGNPWYSVYTVDKMNKTINLTTVDFTSNNVSDIHTQLVNVLGNPYDIFDVSACGCPRLVDSNTIHFPNVYFAKNGQDFAWHWQELSLNYDSNGSISSVSVNLPDIQIINDPQTWITRITYTRDLSQFVFYDAAHLTFCNINWDSKNLEITDKIALKGGFKISTTPDNKILVQSLDNHFGTVYLVAQENVFTIDLSVPEVAYNYNGTPVVTNVSVATYDPQGNYVSAKVKLILLSGNAAFLDSNSNEYSEYIVTTDSNGPISVPLSIKGPGTITIEADYVLDSNS